MNQIAVDHKKRICVYDDLFELKFRQYIFEFAVASRFVIGWADGSIIENQSNRFLHSIYSEEDLSRLGIVDRIQNSRARHELDGYKIERCILNLSTASDTNYVHSHPEDKLLLYYVNLEWRDGWHGETLFFAENIKDICFASPYTPGRLIAFDAHIPHTIRPQSHIAAQYRFTLAMILNKC